MTSLVGSLTDELFGGTGTSDEVPSIYDVGLDGRPFMVDTRFSGKGADLWGRKGVALYKQQQDQSGVVSEASLNPDDLARRAQESWHKGAGQRYFDRDDSDPARFYSSKGVDVLTEKWRAPMLPATDQKLTSVATNLHLAVAGAYLYVLDGTAIKYTQDITVDTPTWTAMTGTPGTTWKALTSDGYYLYATDGTNVYQWARGAAGIGAAFNAQDVDVLAYVRGKARLMGGLNTGATRSLVNITGGGAPTDVKPSIISPDFNWVGFGEAANVIYDAGYQGDKTLVFRQGIKTDGTGLDAAVPALPDGLPDGEILRAIYSYQGYVALGTDLGVWICKPDGDGNLEANKVLELDVAVRCFEGQGRFLRFGWTNYDGTSTGLGKMDLSVDTAGRSVITPAYAYDLFAVAQGNVLSIATFQGRTVFTVSGSGVWAEDTVKVTTATLRTGLITYGMADPKVAAFVTLAHEPLDGTLAVGIATDGSETFSPLGTSMDEDAKSIVLPTTERAENFELELTWTRDSGDTTDGPALVRWLFEANFAPGRGQRWAIPLQFAPSIDTKVGPRDMDVKANLDALLSIIQYGRAVAHQDASGTTTVYIDDFELITDGLTPEFERGCVLAYVSQKRRRST